MQPEDNITSLKGIGEATAEKLKRLEIINMIDLLRHIPRRYIDYSNPKKISQINKDKQHVSLVAQLSDIKSFYTKSGKLITQATATDSTGKLKLIWFNNPYIKKIIQLNTVYTIAGQVSDYSGSFCLISPTIEEEDRFSLNTKGLVPIYPQTNGIKSTLLRKYIFQALSQIQLKDPLQLLPTIKNHPDVKEAYFNIHFPKNSIDRIKADKRLSFNEHLKICLNNQIELNILGKSPSINIDQQIHHDGLKKLPFSLTSGQEKTLDQILKDISKTQYTHRLVQGDTGSGKTATIILAANQVIASQKSCVILAPTQILANQHYQSFKNLSLYPENIALITGNDKPKDISKPTIFIGTHSLLNVLNNQNNDLVFFAIDEQHKFGVDQRELFSKQKNPPHIINLSATPIPRTVAQGLLGEISISTIKSKPLDRLPIKTYITNQKHFDNKGFQWLISNFKQNPKVFVVAPSIYTNSTTNSVEELYQKYKQKIPSTIEIYALHGKIKPDEQNKIISNFINSKAAILISTSLIEVGIDIKSANTIIIHSAERFGLAQLHQLRGRVGRGNQQGYCFLIPTKDDQEETERLNLLTKYRSGLTLAKKDLILRGSGEVFGNKQHGTFQTRLKHFWSQKSYRQAKDIAKMIVKKDPSEAKNIATLLNSC